MDYLIWILIALVALKIVLDMVGKDKKQSKSSNQTQPLEQADNKNNNEKYLKSYKSKYVLTTNEKDAFRKIKEAADETGYTVLSKVRLFDLIEPLDKKDKGAQWKIQAKHVDFVLCDKSLVARYIIELGDKSHERADRSERDAFVLTVLRNCGYKVLLTNNIDKDRLISWIQEQEQTK